MISKVQKFDNLYFALTNLYGFKLPVRSYLHYYIPYLKEFYPEVNDIVTLAENYEGILAEDKHKYIAQLVKVLISKGYIDKLNTIEMPKYELENKEIDLPNGEYVSLDVKQGNWTVLKLVNSLTQSFDEFCIEQNIPEIFYKSKSFRQHVMGNTNPKRLLKLQKSIISDWYNSLKKDSIEPLIIRNDELIYDAKLLESVEISDSTDKCMNLKRFSLENIESHKDKFQLEVNLDTNIQKIKNCNGNRWWIYFKELIKNEMPTAMDHCFYVDGHIAKWMD